MELLFYLVTFILLQTLCTLAYSSPNFIIFLADDLGIGDVGCFGNDTIKTPNIDSLAKSGAILKHHVAAAAVCTPSRSALLTGRYPVRMGMESSSRNKVFFFIAQSGGLPKNETTIAKVLKKKGYATAAIGKWHLGNDCHNKGDLCHHPFSHGFDYFYGLPLSNFKDLGGEESVITTYLPNFYAYIVAAFVVSLSILAALYRSHTKLAIIFLTSTVIIPALICYFLLNLRTFNGVIFRDDIVVEQPIRLPGLTQRFVIEAKEFIQRSVDKNTPFFLYLPFVHVHTALFTSKQFAGVSQHGKYGDNVQELDWAVGEIRNFLRDLDLLSDTFIYFSSDNGGHVDEYGKNGQREGGYNGIYSGGKTIAGYEGGIRVPSIVSWPEKIVKGIEINVLTSQMDLFATVLEITEQKFLGAIIDGKSMMPLLGGMSQRSLHDILFHYCGRYIHAATYTSGKQAWKIHWTIPKFLPGTMSCGYVCHCFGEFVVHQNPPLMYNLSGDPSESTPLNISASKKLKAILDKVTALRLIHEGTVQNVPDQFSLSNSMWKPWLQPCCNFPSCSCSDSKYIDIM